MAAASPCPCRCPCHDPMTLCLAFIVCCRLLIALTTEWRARRPTLALKVCGLCCAPPGVMRTEHALTRLVKQNLDNPILSHSFTHSFIHTLQRGGMMIKALAEPHSSQLTACPIPNLPLVTLLSITVGPIDTGRARRYGIDHRDTARLKEPHWRETSSKYARDRFTCADRWQSTLLARSRWLRQHPTTRLPLFQRHSTREATAAGRLSPCHNLWPPSQHQAATGRRQSCLLKPMPTREPTQLEKAEPQLLRGPRGGVDVHVHLVSAVRTTPRRARTVHSKASWMPSSTSLLQLLQRGLHCRARPVQQQQQCDDRGAPPDSRRAVRDPRQQPGGDPCQIAWLQSALAGRAY